MLHIKDIEAFARINEALFRAPGAEPEASGEDLRTHPAILLARLMAAAQQPAEPPATASAPADEPPAERPTAEVVQLVPPHESETLDESADSVGGSGYDFDLVPSRPMTMAGLFSRMMFGRR